MRAPKALFFLFRIIYKAQNAVKNDSQYDKL